MVPGQVKTMSPGSCFTSLKGMTPLVSCVLRSTLPYLETCDSAYLLNNDSRAERPARGGANAIRLLNDAGKVGVRRNEKESGIWSMVGYTDCPKGGTLRRRRVPIE